MLERMMLDWSLFDQFMLDLSRSDQSRFVSLLS
jgi:hypothetical protein